MAREVKDVIAVIGQHILKKKGETRIAFLDLNCGRYYAALKFPKLSLDCSLSCVFGRNRDEHFAKFTGYRPNKTNTGIFVL